MKFPTPRQLGLPEKFEKWRPNQEDLARKFLTSTKRVKAADSPTGSGKSGVAALIMGVTKKPTAILTESKGLQDQLATELAGMGAVVLKGRANYECGLRDGATCEDGYSGKCPQRGSHMCPYSQAEMRAAGSSIVILNYDKWTASQKSGFGLKHIQQLMCDEAHSSYDAVSRAMQVQFYDREVSEVLQIDWPDIVDDMTVWRDWAREYRPIAIALWEQAKRKVEDAADPKPSWIRDLTHKRMLMKRLGTLAICNPDHWIVDVFTNKEGKQAGYQFDPIRPGRYAEAVLFNGLESIYMLSATLRPKTMAQLHIAQGSYDFFEVPSNFDPKHCPVYWMPTQPVDSKHPQLHKLLLRIDQIIGRRKDRKALIQTVSFDLRDRIFESSQFSSLMMMNRRGENINDIVGAFKSAPGGTILISPSVSTGFDFPYSECEYQIICKVPFPDSRSKIIKARQADDKEYGPYSAMTKLVQSCGRGMRAADDRCEVFILDDNIEWFRKRYAHLAPKWFKTWFKPITQLPQPPEKL